MDVVNELNVKDVENEQKYYRLAKIGFLGTDQGCTNCEASSQPA